MRRLMTANWHLVLCSIVLLGIVAVNVFPYGGKLSAVFHMDTILSANHDMPKDFVVLDVPAYDGAQYYLVARNIPDMVQPDRWDELQTVAPTSYGYQRFLLPALAFLLSFGQTPFLPYAFLLINVASLLGVFWIASKTFPRIPLYTFALTLCPAAMVGLHFNIAEPVTLFLLTFFLSRFIRSGKLGTLDVFLLSLAVLAREVNIIFSALLGCYFLYKKQWRDAGLMFIPLAVFLLLHGWIYAIFDELPFFMSTGKSTLPFQAVWTLLTGGYGYDYKTLTSIPLFLFVVLPALSWTAWLIIKRGDRSFLASELDSPLTVVASGPPLTVPQGHCWFLGGEIDGRDQMLAAVEESSSCF